MAELTRSSFNKKAFSLIAFLLIIVLLGAYLPATIAKAYTGYPTFDIVSVVKDTSVTIQTNNLPPNQTFTVRMGAFGTKAVGGTIVGTTDSGAGGTQKLTYNIPAALKGSAQIAIRMDSPSGYYAYNWFNNVNLSATVTATTATPTKTSGTPTATKTSGTPSTTKTAVYTGIPTFSIVSVIKDTSVTIKTNNFPAGKTFTVRMGKIGTKAIGGIIVGTKDSGSGGAFEATFNIPAELKGLAQIAIRMDGTGGYYAYNWFVNSPLTGATATPGGPTATPGGPTKTPTKISTPGYTGFPTFSISAVVSDTSVTIKAKNFPANQTFTVRMGAYGTAAIGGTVAGTKESGTGGEFEATYNIPAALKGSTKIAIRMDSPAGYFAYNWFWNNTYP